MNEKEILHATERADFAYLNGAIMRICNLLKPSQRNLNAVYMLCKNDGEYNDQQIQQSFTYLCDAGYIRIDHPKGTDYIEELSSGAFGKVKMKVTAKGMQLLMDALQDPCVEI